MGRKVIRFGKKRFDVYYVNPSFKCLDCGGMEDSYKRAEFHSCKVKSSE